MITTNQKKEIKTITSLGFEKVDVSDDKSVQYQKDYGAVTLGAEFSVKGNSYWLHIDNYDEKPDVIDLTQDELYYVNEIFEK